MTDQHTSSARRDFLRTTAFGITAAAFPAATMLFGRAQGQPSETPTTAPAAVPDQSAARGPIIDVHMHAYPAQAAIDASLSNPVTGKPPGAKDGEAHMRACFAEMKRLNIVKGVVSGGTGDRLAAAMQWHDAAPDRIIPGAGIRGSDDTPLPELGVLRKAFAERRLRVLGEVTAEYAGLTLSDPQYAAYLALAEEFDVPVALHTGTAPPGISYDPCCRRFRVSLGNPALIEEALNRHPKLRVNLMHAAWPYLQETIAIMNIYPQVYADLGWCGWGLPRDEFHAYLGSLVRAGFSQRVMFGSDHMYWPDLIGMSVDAIDSVPFLTPTQKRDIFHDNAVRFYKL
jgi:predicted TIM-barrel fold metal-dependent hydrolase